MAIENTTTESSTTIVAKFGNNSYTQRDLNDLFFAFALHDVHKITGMSFYDFACIDTNTQSAVLSTLSNYESKKPAVDKHREHLDKESSINVDEPIIGVAHNKRNQHTSNIPPWLEPKDVPSWAMGGANSQPVFGRPAGTPNINTATLHDSLRLVLVCLPVMDAAITQSCFNFQGYPMTVNQALSHIYGAIQQFHAGAIRGNKF